MHEGAQIGPYVLRGLLAEGGMARVYAAQSTESGLRVALKVPIHLDEPDVLDQVRHEVQAMARLTHPHIVPVLDWGSTADGQIYLAMPLVDDRSLREVAGGVDEQGVLALVDQLLDALAYAHDRGVIHRDVKARNLLVTEEPGAPPHLWLTDFGIASLDTGGSLGEELGPVGTPTYMAPEQLRGETNVTPQADLYAVGVLLYLLFEGRRPFPGSTLTDVMASRRTAPRPDFTDRALRAVPPGLEPIVHRLLAEDPLDRYPSASSLRMALAALAPESTRRPLEGGVCLECGERIRPGMAFCPVCETGVPTLFDTGPSPASIATHKTRAVTALAAHIEATHRPLVMSLLERAGAYVRWTGETRAIAAFGVYEESGGELARAAELGLALAQMAEARVGIAPAGVRLGGESVLELRAEDASLLADAADPGGVRISATLREALGASHEIAVDGERCRLLGPVLSKARMNAARLAPLTACAQSVEQRGCARAITLVGENGSGRTLALLQLRELLSKRGWTALSASAAPASEPFGVLSAAIRSFAGLWPGTSRASCAAKLDSYIDDAAVASGAAAVIVADRIEADPGARARALDALGAFFDRLAARAPVLLAIDDLVHVDPSTRELLSILIERLAQRPLLIVTSAEPEQVVLAGSERIELLPMDDEDAHSLIKDVPSSERRRLVKLAAGNPQKLLELGRNATKQAAMLDEDTAERLQKLDAEERAVIELAAAAGRRFFVGQLFDMAGARLEARLGPVLRNLVRQHVFELVEPSSVPGARELVFADEALCDASLARVAHEDACVGHAAAARWLERNASHLGGALVSTIAAHWDAAENPRRAAAWHVRAARRAEAVGELHVALESYRRALVRLDRETLVKSSLDRHGVPFPVDVPSLLGAIARVGVACGEIEHARAAAERLLEVEEPPRAVLRGQARAALAEIARMQGDPQSALLWIDEALRELGPEGDRILRAQLLGRRGWILGYVLGKNDEGRSDGEQALRLLDGLSLPAIESHIYSDLGANELRAGLWDRQLACNRRALALAKTANELSGQVRAHINLSVCYTNRGELERAAEHATEASSLALRTGMHRARIIALNNLGIVELDRGELARARELLESVIELCERHGIRDILHETLPSLGRVLLAQGEIDRALERASEGARIAEREGNTVGVALACRVQALVRARAGDRDAALRALIYAKEALGKDGDAYELAVTDLTRALLLGEDLGALRATLRKLGAEPELEIRRWSVD